MSRGTSVVRLELSDGIDYSAKSLIRYCLVQAAQTSLDRSREEWVTLAEAAKSEEDIDFTVICSIADESGLSKLTDPDERARKQVEDHIK